jgi:uncharacterized protein YraI
VTRAIVGRLAVVLAAATLASTVWAATPSGAVEASTRHPCRAGVTYRLLTSTAPRTVVVKVPNANVRRGPGTDCTRITSFARGARLATTGARARVGGSIWLQVTGGFGVGWVAATLVR